MKFYKVKAVASVQDVTPDSETHWVGTQADAAKARKKLADDGFKRAEITTDEVDVPTDKTGLLDWLNKNAR